MRKIQRQIKTFHGMHGMHEKKEELLKGKGREGEGEGLMQKEGQNKKR